MFVSIFESALFEIFLVILVVATIIAVSSVFIIKNLQFEYKKVYKIRSRFHIEIRKIVNLIYKVYNSEILEPFTKVVIKNLPHAEKSILLRNIDKVFESLDVEASDNKYIVETYENLQKLRRERDVKILAYNQKIRMFPFSIYARIMKLESYDTYTEKY
jgi:Xaa-Pro aminopeptidase